MGKTRTPWERWPLSNVRRQTPIDVGLELRVGDQLPDHVSEAIRTCSIMGRAVYIVWVSAAYVVLECIEPVTDEEEKRDLLAHGLSWEDHLAQAFEVIPTVGDEIDETFEWEDTLRDAATEMAVRYFDAKSDVPLFVLDDSISTEFPSAVSFSVGGLAFAHVKPNREAVLEWAASEFVLVIASTMVMHRSRQ